MESRLIAGLAAAVAAVVGLLLVASYANGADSRAQAALEPTTALVVTAAVPAGTPVESLSASLEVRQLPGSAVAGSALPNLDGQAGKVTSTDLVPGEPLLAERLVSPDQLVSSGSVPVPEGMQETTFAVSPVRVVGGKVAAGDTVGIFSTFAKGIPDGEAIEKSTTQRVFHRVLVTSVQRAEGTAADAQANPESMPGEASMYVTVAVDDADAHKLIFAAEFGRIWLTREPEDAREAKPAPMTIEKVYP